MSDEDNKDHQTYGLKEPFDIDAGELDGVSPVQAFTLGVEWQMVSEGLGSGESIERPIHDENVSRIKRMCIRRGRKFRVKDNGPEWKWLSVANEGGHFRDEVLA